MVNLDTIMGRAHRMFSKEIWEQDDALRANVRARGEHFIAALLTLAKKRGQNPRKIRAATHSVLASIDARFICLVLSYPKKALPVSFEMAMEFAAQTKPWIDCDEPVEFYLMDKPEGGTRPIWKFGPKRRLLQCLAREVLAAIWGSAQFEYAQRGRGREAAMDEVRKFTEMKGGARWFLTADINNCFGSFNREALFKIIPLPRSVIEHCIFVLDGTLIVSTGISPSASGTAVLSGLPQGSLASFRIASNLIEPVLDKLQGVVKLSYADDIIAGSRKQEEAEANKLLLGDLLLDHPAGPLFMRSAVATLGQPIDFLGYRIRRRPILFGGGIRYTPSPTAFDRFEIRAYDRLSKKPAKTRFEEAQKYKREWCNSNRSWDRSEQGDLMMDITLHHLLSGISHAQWVKAKKT
jgi:hypothetical protein